MDVHDGGPSAFHGLGEPGAAPAGPQGSPPDPATTAGGASVPSPREAAGGASVPSPRGAADGASVPSPRGAADKASVPSPREAVREPRTGVAALSLRYQIVVAVAVAVVAVTVCVHICMVFLSVAPSNTVTKQHGRAIDDWIYPEFEQNWKLFAPNPLQQNIAVQVRAQIDTPDGRTRTTGWYDLSAEDGRAIDGNLLPSHTEQNELRRAWDFFVSTHDSDSRPLGLRGSLSETYLRRIMLLRLGRDDAAGKGGAIELVQVRSRTTNVRPPEWSGEKVSDQPVYRVLPWWSIPADSTERDVK